MKKYKIRKDDYYRCLITETTPYETPIIFSNAGFYNLITNKDQSNAIRNKIIEILISKSTEKTIPYHYKIKKDNIDYRRLALVHPSSQIAIKNFYEKYENLMLHFCKLSPASIRSIRGIASSFYKKKSWETINKFKKDTVSLKIEDKYSQYSPSFFSYKGFDRLYKFFNSKLFFQLEKRYTHLRTIDISKCFDSLYTHTLLWATKDKEYAKSNLRRKNFADTFDQVMRKGNYEETNGIPIGAEVSRIFAEIILQRIDINVIKTLEKEDLHYNKQYTFYRYVDDIFIFTHNIETSDKIYKVIASELLNYNLHINSSKSITKSRPFITNKSKTIYLLSNKANDFFEKFLEHNEFGTLSPKSIRSSWKLSKNFIDAIKETCANQNVDYPEVAPYLIALINERIKKIISRPNIEDANTRSKYHITINTLLEILFFLYTVAPSVGASYRLCTSLILIHRFSKESMETYHDSICANIYKLVLELLSSQSFKNNEVKSTTFLNLESINIILASSELGENYLLPPQIFTDLLNITDNFSYFTAISSIYYFKDIPIYKKIKDTIIQRCLETLTNFDKNFSRSELVHLYLDLIYCPYINRSAKEHLIGHLFKNPPKKIDIKNFIDNKNNEFAFINWKEIDLLNILEKKEMTQAY